MAMAPDAAERCVDAKAHSAGAEGLSLEAQATHGDMHAAAHFAPFTVVYAVMRLR